MTILEPTLLFLALIGAVISSATDIKRGIIPNRLTLPLIGFGIAGNFYLSLFYSDFSIITACIYSILVMFILGYVFWLLGGWSAGDVKELLFIAALIPRYPEILRGIFSPALGPYPFILTVVINTFLAIFPVVAAYSLAVALYRAGPKEFLMPLRDIKKTGTTALIFLGIVAVASVSNIPVLFVLIILLLLRVNQNQRIVISLIFILIYTVFSPVPFLSKAHFLGAYFLGTLVLFSGFSLLLNSFKVFRVHVLQKEKPVSELTEGDVLGEEIYMLGDRVVKDSRGLLEKTKELMGQKGFPSFDRHPVAGTSAAGITKDEVMVLKRLVEEGKLKGMIRVKKSMPFAPVILAGLIISLTLGDLGVIMRRLYG
jgi:preflagellin peptidase FlaK